MPAIVSHILKRPCGKGQCYPLQYRDLEASVVGLSAEDIYLSVSFRPDQAYWLEQRRHHVVTGTYHLVEATYHPDAQALDSTRLSVPWHDRAHPIVVKMQVFALPAAAARLLNRTLLRDLLRQHVATLSPHGLPAERWHLRLTLLTHEQHIESQLARWRGLRSLGQTTHRIDLSQQTPVHR